jgi:hypothetical protein
MPAVRATTGFLRWLTVTDTLLKNRRRKQIASFDTLVLQFSESQRPAIWVQAPSKNFTGFPRKLRQSIPLCSRQSHYLNLHVRAKLPASKPATG